MKWFSKEDKLSLNIKELNFGKKCRGKKSQSLEGLVPEKFTRRNCAGKVAEIFDLLGKFTPITAGLKLDLTELSKRNLKWDDEVPDDLKSVWNNNFELIQNLGDIKHKRVVVPRDAVNLELETIETADASEKLACAAIYGRFKLKSGGFSCQLLFAKSKIISQGMTIPRAELFAATLNASTRHVVYASLKKFIKKRVHLTDSQITLFWITNTKLKMKQYVRNRVIEICRLTNRDNWYYVESQNMMADLGTRKGTKIDDIKDGSPWMTGKVWTQLSQEHWPIKCANDIKLRRNDFDAHKDESMIFDDEWINKSVTSNNFFSNVTSQAKLNEIGERYKYSKYIIDLNKFRFRKVVRILGLVYLFLKNLKRKTFGYETNVDKIELPSQLKCSNDKYLITESNKFPFCAKKV